MQSILTFHSPFYISTKEKRKKKKEMIASNSSVIQVSCSLQRPPPLSPKYAVHSKVSFTSPLSLKKRFPIIHNLGRTVKEASLKLLDAFVDLTFQFVDQPLLPSQSNFAPVEEIGAAVEVVGAVSGTIPDDFTEGVYIRNGSNPIHGGLKSTSSIFGKSSNIWVEGEGMVHALYFKKQRDGTWLTIYNNKYIETDSLRLERQNQQQKQKPAFLPSVEGDSTAVLACSLLNSIRFGSGVRNFSNTNVFEHAGKYYSITETDLFGPLEIDINTLQTLGTWDVVKDAWNRTFTSHPKRAPGTRELVTFGIDAEEPYFKLGVISADGKKLNHKVDLKFQRCTLIHDIGVTQMYNVILDFPTIIDLNRLFIGGSIIKFEKDKFARIGVMPRYGDADSVRWFEVEPCSMFHIINCYEEGDEVIVMGCRAQDSIIPGPDLGMDKSDWFSRGFKLENSTEKKDDGKEEEFGFLVGRPYEWRLNTKTGEVKQRYLVEPQFSMDFPFINDKFTGINNKYGYTQVVHSTASAASAIAKYGGLAKLSFEEKNLGPFEAEQKGEEYIKAEYHMFPENTFCSGSAFIAKLGAGTVEEDDGWLITFVHNEDTDISEVYIIDAKNFTSEPVAKITLPCRVPYGFHGAFLPAIQPV
ncbi:carotenoid 9,10(9',10')-cleavage dioxygenase 1-like isoform X2 [Primulina eburnea]|uniref:carotenoid 9,10(9',10')-cleavage dioxygenase 1-like isoform X2 n=1 Tax=Primulina eburnea TaxID=1245227 RepID=UPI003C6BDE91